MCTVQSIKDAQNQMKTKAKSKTIETITIFIAKLPRQREKCEWDAAFHEFGIGPMR